MATKKKVKSFSEFEDMKAAADAAVEQQMSADGETKADEESINEMAEQMGGGAVQGEDDYKVGQIIGKCVHCGQQKYVDAYDSDAADRIVIRQCDCARGAQSRADMEKQYKRTDNIERVTDGLDAMDEYCKGYSITLSQGVKDVIINGAGLIMDGVLTKLKIKFGSVNKIDACITENQQGDLFLDYQYSNSQRIKI